MTIGASLFLIAVGAILRWAVTGSVAGISLPIAGLILMIVGAVGLLIGLIMMGAAGADTGRRRSPPRDTSM